MGDSGEAWPAVLSRRLGAAVAAARKEKGLSAVKLAEATAEIGMAVHRVAIPRIEKGEQVVTVPELIVLGIALEADWSLWLMDAADAADVGDARYERMRLEAQLAEIMAESNSVLDRLRAAQAQLANPQLPDKLRSPRETEVHAYNALLASLRAQEVAVQDLIRLARLGVKSGDSE